MVDCTVRVRLLLSLQAALLGNIGANIRAITCGVFDATIKVNVVFDGEILDSDVDLMDEVGSEVASHFSEEHVEIECFRIDSPQRIENAVLDWYVYLRKE